MLIFLGIIIIVWIVISSANKRILMVQQKGETPVKIPKEEILSQSFLLSSVILLGIVLIVLSKYFNNFLTGPMIVFIIAVVNFIMAYYFKATHFLVFGIISFLGWWFVQSVIWINFLGVKPSMAYAGLILIALLLYVLGRMYEKNDKFKSFNIIYTVFGLIAILAFLFLGSTTTGISLLERVIQGRAIFTHWQTSFFMLAILIILLSAMIYAFKRKQLLPIEVIIIMMLISLAVIIALMPEQKLFINQQLSKTGLALALGINITTFIVLLSFIFIGYYQHSLNPITIGTGLLFIFIMMKYFDWFLFSLNPSIFFISAGILFFVLGWLLERGRKLIVIKMKSQI